MTLGTLTAGNSFASFLTRKGSIALVVSPDDIIANAIPPVWALGELKTALESQGSGVRVIKSIADSSANEYCVIVSGIDTSIAQSIIARSHIIAPTDPESLCLVQTEIDARTVLLAAGTDPLGLVYALTELADRVICLSSGRSALEINEPVIESPASRTRSIIRHFSSEIEDKAWFYDHDYWRSYLTMLVTSRVNRLSFTMGMGYDSAIEVTDGYMVFPFPFFFTVPGYDVSARGLRNEEQARNLAMLKFISEQTTLRGLRFQVGIWTLTHEYIRSPDATYAIEGINNTNHSVYCRDALGLLLNEVPGISGITFRVHSESGIPEGQESFWKTVFSAVAKCGRQVEIDLHAKNMEPETLNHALNTGMPVVISPKYCGEHLSLPYHQSSIREAEMVSSDKFTDTGEGVLIGNRGFTRYGYADTLAENRTWDVVFRIWPGTQRFLLNADPATFAGYSRNASFCGAAGIELYEPLGFKGRQGSGIAGGRNAYADPTLTPRYDFEKYLYTYRLWGRLGYNPDADPEVWRRSLRREFGKAAVSVENALAPVSRVLPLFTLAHGATATCMLYWPEIYTNMPMADINAKHPYNDTRSPRLFGNVSPFDPQLFQSPDECGDSLVAGQPTGKYTPLEVAWWLTDIAASASAHLEVASKQLGSAVSQPAFRRVEEDVLILKGLALFFAGKLRSAVLWRIFAISGNREAGTTAISYFIEGRTAWAAMAERAKSVYRSDISYGRDLHGHWLDRIPSFDADIDDLQRRIDTPTAIVNKPDADSVERAIKIAKSRPERPIVVAQHQAPEHLQSGLSLTISLSVLSGATHRIIMHYRHVNQAERWQSVDLRKLGDIYQGEIPAEYTAKRYPLQYYFEIVTGRSEATLFPMLASDLANVPYYVVRRARIKKQ
jgi:hypothetical protein